MENTPPGVVPAESLPLVGEGDAEGDKLRQLAIDTDDGALTQEPDAATPQAQDSAQTSPDRATGAGTAEQKPDSPETSAQRDDKGRFLPKTEAKPEGTAEPPKPESAYDKAKKEQERQKSVLANFEAEKQRERAAIAAERQQLEQQRAMLQSQAAQGQQPRFNSQHLWQAATEFDENARKLLKDGDIDAANGQLELASKARTEAQKNWYYEQQEAAQNQAVQGKSIWEQSTKEIFEATPEDQREALAQDIGALFQQEPILTTFPEGIRLAYRAVTINRQYAEVSGLRERAEKAEKELKELKERTSIAGSGPVPHLEPKGFDQMSEAEQENYLRRNAHAYDRERFAA